MTVIVAFDPGRTTGVALYNGNAQPGEEKILAYQLSEPLLSIWGELQVLDPDEVVYERFQYQRRPNVDLYPVEVIGVIKLWTQIYKEADLKEQTPAQAKNLWTDSKLKTLGLWKPSLPHAMDALRHLLYYMTVWKDDRTWINLLKPQ